MNERTTQRIHPARFDAKTRAVQTETWFQWFQLPISLRELWQQNPASRHPYHGQHHLQTVALLTVDASRFYYHLPEPTQKALFVAGLFHDYGYQLSDDETTNIRRAKNTILGYLPQSEIAAVSDLIEATFYPHKTPKHHPAAIIQDADSLQLITPDYDRFLKGLQAEGHVEVNPKFPGENHLTTTWAKDLYRDHIFSR